MACMQNFRKRKPRKIDEKDKNQFAERIKMRIINLVENELGDSSCAFDGEEKGKAQNQKE